MLLIAVLIYVAIAGVVVFALAFAAASHNASDVPIERDAEIVELALAQHERDVRRVS